MNRAIVFLTLILGLWLPKLCISQTLSNPQENTSEQVIESIRKANAGKLSASFGNSIDLTLPSNDGTFSRTQAEMILKDFFRKNPPKSFTIKQQGSSKDGARFTIATYVSANDQKFRTYFLVKKLNGEYIVQLLQFEIE